MAANVGEDPISKAKLAKGDGTWNTQKEILGWIFDGQEYTIVTKEKMSKD
jgi:hypothetical protein